MTDTTAAPAALPMLRFLLPARLAHRDRGPVRLPAPSAMLAHARPEAVEPWSARSALSRAERYRIVDRVDGPGALPIDTRVIITRGYIKLRGAIMADLKIDLHALSATADRLTVIATMLDSVGEVSGGLAHDTMQAIRDTFVELGREIGPEDPVMLVGFSQGGKLAASQPFSIRAIAVA